MHTAKIVVRRPVEGYRDLIRAYQIRVDGRPVGKLKRGEEQIIDVSPGEHDVRMHIDWCSSPAVRIRVGPGETITLRTRPNPDAGPAIWAITFGRGQYIALEPIAAPA